MRLRDPRTIRVPPVPPGAPPLLRTWAQELAVAFRQLTEIVRHVADTEHSLRAPLNAAGHAIHGLPPPETEDEPVTLGSLGSAFEHWWTQNQQWVTSLASALDPTGDALTSHARPKDMLLAAAGQSGSGGPPSGPAGGDLAGTYPNPTLALIGSAQTVGNSTTIPQVSIDAKGRVVGLTGVPASSTPSGPAGGDLAGTYPNPTLAVITTAASAGSGTQIPTLTIDAKGRVTALGQTAVAAAGGPASGDLAGTYPGPTVPRLYRKRLGFPSIGGLPSVARTSLQPLGGPPSGPAGGDLAGTYPNPVLVTITTAGSAGSATQIPQLTIDAKGRVTGLTQTAVGAAGGPASGDLAGTYPAPTIPRLYRKSLLPLGAMLLSPSQGTLSARYALLGGRPGGQTLQGGIASGETLTLRPNGPGDVAGRVRLDGLVQFFPSLTNITNVKAAAAAGDQALSLTASTARFTALEVGSQQLTASTWTVSVNLTSAFGAGGSILTFSPTIQNSSGTALTDMGNWAGMNFQPKFRADGAAVTVPISRAYTDTTATDTINAGSLTVTEQTSVLSQPSLGAGTTVTTRRGLWFRDRTGTGSQATAIAVDVEALTASTLAASLRSVGSNVQMQHAGPALFGATGGPNANLMMDVNGGLALRGASITLANGTNTAVNVGNRSLVDVTGPTAAFTIAGIAGGVDGKLLIIVNRTSQNMTIAHESTSETTTANRINTSTAANVSTTGAGYVTLVYSAAASRWLLLASQL
jgi:hypothetical protein